MKSADHEEEHMPGQDDYARSQSLGPRFRPEDNEFYKRLDGETDSKFRQRIVDAALTEKRHPSKIVLSGKVIDSGGNPIAGAEITLKKYIKQKSIGMGAFGSVAIERVTFSREDGRFSLINVTPGRKLVYASKKGYRKAPPKEVLLEECKKAEKAVNAEVVIVLRAKANVLTISGTCRDVKGFPIEGAKVCVRMTEYEKERDACFGRTHSAVSDRMGRFVVGNLQRGTGVGTVSGVIRIPPGHQPEKFIVILAAASQTARDMETAVSVKGESTKFRLEGVQPGEYVAFCHAKRLARGEVRNIKVAPGVETEGVVMELTAGGVLSGTVRWKDAEANVSAALVVLKPAMEDRGQVRQMSTDRNGVFVLENVVPGQYYISASKGTVSSPDGHTQVVIEDGEKKNIEIELHRGKTIRGKITCHDKSGLSSILVACYPKEAQPIMTKPVRDGYFAFHHLGPGNYKGNRSRPYKLSSFTH
jgi:protocatechuate 3,4-dioxygenase beta subunit